MRILSFLPKELSEYIESYFSSKKQSITSKKNDIVYKNFSLNQLNPIEISEFSPDIILILSEFPNTTENLFGYHIAQEIFNFLGTPSIAPYIQFISFFSRKDLYTKSDGSWKQFYVKSFPHIELPFNDSTSLKSGSFSRQKWNYLRNYALKEYGILDILIHDINDDFDLEVTTSTLNKYILRLKAIKDKIGIKLTKTIDEIENSWDSINPEIELNKIMHFLRERLEEINDPQNTLAVRPNRPKVLLLEDNISHSKRFKEKFSPVYDIIEFTDGEEAIEELNENRATLYSAILIDLQLLDADNLFWQDVQGIDVIEHVKERYPHLATRIITGLTTTGVKELTHGLNIKNDEIILKRNLDYFFEPASFQIFINKLDNDININSVFAKMWGPDLNVWADYGRQQNNPGGRLKRFYYEFLITDKDEFKSFIEELHHYFGELIESQSDNLIPTTFPKKEYRVNMKEHYGEQELKNILRTLLLHRLFWLHHLYQGEGSAIYNVNEVDGQYFEKPCFAFLPKPTNDKRHSNYGPVIGFSIGIRNDKEYEFIFNQLFPEEIEWLKINKPNTDIDFKNKFKYLSETYYDMLVELNAHKHNRKYAHPHAFDFKEYPITSFPESLDNFSNLLSLILKNESKKRNTYIQRTNLTEILHEFKVNAPDEYQNLPQSTIKNIERIINLLV